MAECYNINMDQGVFQDKARGMLVGLAVGDALGAPVEFGYTSHGIRQMGDEIENLRESMILPAGAWTDDTSMALCLADSLLEKGGYDSYDIMDKFRSWVVYGYRSFDNKPAFDVGTQTANAIGLYHRDPIIHKNEPKTESAGNGTIMRLAPVVIANCHNKTNTRQDDMEKACYMATLSCRETHNSDIAIDITGMFATVLCLAFYGLNKKEILSRRDELYRYYKIDGLSRINDKSGDTLADLGGYVVDCFTIALWGLINFNTFREGMLAVIRLGGDTDTNAACYGQLAGAYYGYKAIPKEWSKNVLNSEELIEIADELLNMKECPIIQTRFEGNRFFKKPNDFQERIVFADPLKKEEENEQAFDEDKPEEIQSIGEILKSYIREGQSKSKKDPFNRNNAPANRSDRRERLKSIFDDTRSFIRKNQKISDETIKASKEARFYDYADFEAFSKVKPKKTILSVTSERSLEAAKRMLNEKTDKVAVLNFANCSTPGGGVFGGSGAQEESLCRCSNLYPIISQERFQHLYYDPNRARWDPRATDALIYARDVTVFKSDTDYPELIPEDEWYKVDIITCAAPNLRHGTIIYDDRLDEEIEMTHKRQYDIHLSRARHIYNVALANGARRLVLGAFGCGAFRNDPDAVARAFKDALSDYEGQFDEIVFAIYHQPYELDNYETFKKVFNNKE